MKAIDVFRDRRARGEAVLVAYFPLGNVKFDTVEMAKAYVEGGVDILEIGVPVRNPHLDGPVVTHSMEEALAVHPDLDWYLDEIARMREVLPDTQLELFSYKETAESIGLDRLITEAKAHGAECALFPDLSDEEFVEYYATASNPEFPLIKFLPYDSTDEYVDYVAKQPYGSFIFLQANGGKTGTKADLDPRLADKIKRARDKIDLPICVGFGISTPEQAAQVRKMGGDGVVIGSFVVKYLVEHSLPELTAMLRTYKDAISIEIG